MSDRRIRKIFVKGGVGQVDLHTADRDQGGRRRAGARRAHAAGAAVTGTGLTGVEIARIRSIAIRIHCAVKVLHLICRGHAPASLLAGMTCRQGATHRDEHHNQCEHYSEQLYRARGHATSIGTRPRTCSMGAAQDEGMPKTTMAGWSLSSPGSRSTRVPGVLSGSFCNPSGLPPGTGFGTRAFAGVGGRPFWRPGQPSENRSKSLAWPVSRTIRPNILAKNAD